VIGCRSTEVTGGGLCWRCVGQHQGGIFALFRDLGYSVTSCGSGDVHWAGQ
jgi:hypothetical protein